MICLLTVSIGEMYYKPLSENHKQNVMSQRKLILGIKTEIKINYWRVFMLICVIYEIIMCRLKKKDIR